MPEHCRQQLPYNDWPQNIRRRWEAAFKSGNFLAEAAAGAHLAPASRAALKSACGRLLRSLNLEGRDLDAEAPEKHINSKVIAAYVECRRTTCSDHTIAIELHHLRLALQLIFPQTDWAWLLNATKRIARKAPARETSSRHQRPYLPSRPEIDGCGDRSRRGA